MVKNGIDFTRLIIEPLVEKTIDILREYVSECGAGVRSINELDFNTEIIARKKLLQMQKANEVIMTIKLKKMSIDVLKYIAPHFNLNLDKLYEDIDDF